MRPPMPTFQRRWSRAAICLVFITIVGVTGCQEDRVTDGTMHNWYDVDEDIALGEQVIASALTEHETEQVPYDYLASPERTTVIQEMVDRISQQTEYAQDFPWEVHYSPAGIVNAWCAPGGKIMVYEGLLHPTEGLVDMNDPNELAMVIGHEIAHATCRHVTRQQSTTTTILICLFPAYLFLAIFIPEALELFDAVAGEGLNLFLPAYSRGSEEQADLVGMMYAAKAGYDPRAAPRIWRRAAERYGDESNPYGSHPSNLDRAEALEEAMPEAIAVYEQAIGLAP